MLYGFFVLGTGFDLNVSAALRLLFLLIGLEHGMVSSRLAKVTGGILYSSGFHTIETYNLNDDFNISYCVKRFFW